MRREGGSYKLVSLRLLSKKLMAKKCEPIEELTIDFPENLQVEFVTMRKGEMQYGNQRRAYDCKIQYSITWNYLRNQLLTATAGEAIMAQPLYSIQR
jgi:GTP-binding protein